ncbi:MAG: stage II sporulation protein M [archaeon]
MVFEYFLEPEKAEQDPRQAFLLAAMLSTIAILLSIILFPQYASFTTLFFVALGSSQFIHKIFLDEAVGAEKAKSVKEMLKRDLPVTKIYFYFFLGMVATFLFWIVVLKDYGFFLFRAQEEFLGIPIAGGNVGGGSFAFLVILLNNILVLTVFFFISIVFTAGSLLVLGWNASLFAMFIVLAAKRVSEYGLLSAITKIALIYSVHSIPEFISYFLAANAGAVLSMGIVKRGKIDAALQNIINDSFVLMFLSYAIVLIAAFLEAFVSPHLIASLF